MEQVEQQKPQETNHVITSTMINDIIATLDAVAKQETALSKIKKTDRAAYREGMKPLRISGAMKVAAGVTTLAEVFGRATL